MKNYLKYSIMITLTLMITIGLAYGQGEIGVPPQANPYETLPTVRTLSVGPAPTVASGTSMMDGILSSSGTVYVTGTTGTVAWLQFGTFNNAPPGGEFPITWVSIQIKYQHQLGLTDDTYRWEWTVGAGAWTPLTAATSVKFDSAGLPQLVSFSQLAEPTDGIWDWTDIANLKVRVYFTRGLTSWDGSTKPLRIFDVWASAYSSPPPPASSPTMSLQAPAITAGTAAAQYIFVEVYCNDVVNMAGWQYRIYYDPLILTFVEAWNYYPWTDPVSELGADYVEFAGTIPTTDPLYLTGVTGKFAVGRLYFLLNDDGSGLPVEPNFSWLRLGTSIIGDASGAPFPHAVYNGYYGTPPEGTYFASWIPASPFPFNAPMTTNWIEEFPVPGNHWHLTSWDDNGDGLLDPSDQIDMTPTDPPGPVSWFHVDQIWECNSGIADTPTVHMILTFKPTAPEFPLGIGILLGLAPAIPLIYLWRTRSKRRV